MSSWKVALGAAVGAVTGFVAGVLVAPKSGKETREDIKTTAVKAKGEVLENVKKAGDTVKDVAKDVTTKANDVKTRVEQAVEGAQEGFKHNPKK